MKFALASGVMRGSLKRAIPIQGILLRVLQLGYALVDLLQTLGGSILSLLFFRRRMLCLMDLLLQMCVGRGKNEIVQLSGALKSGLYSLALLLPLACTDLRCSPRARLFATDASNWGEASVVASVPLRVSAELLRHTLRKSSWTRLLPPGLAWERACGVLPEELELPGEEVGYSMNLLWEVLAKSLEFRVFHKKRSKTKRHINIGELRAFLLEAERLAGADSPCNRDIFALDSQVSLGCLVKGRSASFALNLELERTLGDVLGFGLFSEYCYFNSRSNPNDDPTRGVPLRKPSWKLPSWWCSVAEDQFEEFDRWLRAFSLDDHSMSGLPSFDELLSSEAQDELVAADGGRLLGSADGGAPSDLLPCASEDLREKTLEFSAESFLLEKECAFSHEIFVGCFGALSEEESLEIFAFLRLCLSRHQLLPPENSEFPEVLPSTSIYLDLFSGEKGVARWMQHLTPFWILTFELNDGPEQDLDDLLLRELLTKYLSWGVFVAWGAAPVCASFSQAVCPAVRSKLHPWGLPEGLSANMKEKVERGNSSALWILGLMSLSLWLDILLWVENPDSSFLFRLPPWESLAATWSDRLGFWKLDYCRFGARWRKRTRIYANSVLQGHRSLCTRDHEHIVLRGRKSWTAVAQAYPTLVCKCIAGGLAWSLGCLGEKGGFDPPLRFHREPQGRRSSQARACSLQQARH